MLGSVVNGETVPDLVTDFGAECVGQRLEPVDI